MSVYQQQNQNMSPMNMSQNRPQQNYRMSQQSQKIHNNNYNNNNTNNNSFNNENNNNNFNDNYNHPRSRSYSKGNFNENGMTISQDMSRSNYSFQNSQGYINHHRGRKRIHPNEVSVINDERLQRIPKGVTEKFYGRYLIFFQ